MNINNITKQIELTVGSPQAGFRYDPSAMTPASAPTGSIATPLQTVDVFQRQGFQSDYTVTDAATSLWKQENLTIDPTDPADLQRLKDRVRSGNLTMAPTEQELTAYISNLRENGLDGAVDFSALSRELSSFVDVGAGELSDSLDYIASRFVAALDKLERNYSGDDLAEQMKKLEESYKAGASGLIDSYTTSLQKNLGISNADAQAVKDSFAAILSERVQTYQAALEQVNSSIAANYADDAWLQNHDAFIAAELRKAGGAEGSGARYSVQDLTAAGQIAELYQKEISNAASGSRDEADLALNLAMADMKAETLIGRGLVSDDMAALLRSSRDAGHAAAINAADERLAYRENTRLSGEVAGTFAPMEQAMFEGIYNAVMGAFRQNGGNGAEAIRAGVTYGQAVTENAHAANPTVQRWGMGMENYWKDFYTTPEARELTQLEQQIDDLMTSLGQGYKNTSTFQSYVDSWQSFLTGIGAQYGVNVRA